MAALVLAWSMLQESVEQRIVEMLREGLEARELSDRLARLGPEASAPIAQRMVAEAARGNPMASAMGDALRRLDVRAAEPILLEALRHPETPAETRLQVVDLLAREDGRWDEDSVGDASLPADLRLAIAEQLQRRGELGPLERVLDALGRVRRDAPALAERVDVLVGRLRPREEPAERVVDLPDPAPATPPVAPARVAADAEKGTLQANLLLGFGAVALAVVLLATRRRA